MSGEWFRETPESIQMLAQERTIMVISEIMDKHRPKRIHRDQFRDRDYEECQEGCRYECGTCYEHIARSIVSELGLYEERRTNVMSSGGMTTNSKTGVTTSHSDIRYDRRYVTNWQVIPK